MNSEKKIYLDYAAATPVDDRVFEAMKPFFSENFYNPSAAYLPAKRVREIYENAKDELAHTIGAKGNDLVITAGATESINLAFTVLKNYKNANCLISKIEHASVREAVKNFAAEVREVNVDKTGYLDLKDLEKKIDDKTVLISVAAANNELGTIEPLSEISEIVKKIRMDRLSRNIETPLYLHSDASQAMSLIDLYVSRLGVDMLTINSAKVYGPKGIGALYVAHGIKLSPITFGGGQEMGLRSGTENVPLLVGFSTAAKLAKEHVNGNRKKYEKLSRLFRETLSEEFKKTGAISELKFLGNKKHQLANFVPICFDGIDAERLIFKLENEGIFVSTGAACAASKGEKSHVLSAIGLSDSEIRGSLRISMGAGNTEADIKHAASVIAKTVFDTLGEGPVQNEQSDQIFRDLSQGSARGRGAAPREDGRADSVVSKNLGDFARSTVYVGMSGGVDSSVSAALLKDAGYNVVGVYMKNWSKDLPGMKCPWAEDLADAKRVAAKLGIGFKIFDFEKEYKQKVVDYMLEEFKKGNTPNPDVMCNQEIKFKLFYDIAREDGADFIATGHYANSENGELKKAVDENKDQTYFLYRISKDSIAHTLFPIGNIKKPDVKKLAEKLGLDNAYKKESMGVCFVGDVGMKDFLKEYLKSEEDKKYLRPGKIIDRETKEVLGFHDGAIFYTIGQRHGLNIGGGLPYYVVGKDMEKNEVYVSKNLNDESLWTRTLKLKDVLLRFDDSFDGPVPNTRRACSQRREVRDGGFRGAGPRKNASIEVDVRLRHRAKLEKAVLKNLDGDFENGTATCELEFEDEIKKTAAGQSAVIYTDETCLGGGVVAS